MDVTLDTEAKCVSGIMNAFWVNNTDEIVPDIQLHMYMNCFKSDKTTVFTELGSSPGKSEEQRGWIDINSFKLADGTNLMSALQYIQPDDGNVNDSTVLRVLLPKPAQPGDTVNIVVDFTTKIPGSGRRTGYNEDFFFVGQWFPKFGVYEPEGMRHSKGAWNCHQFHANSEFYADHSVYEINITTPVDYVVGTGGLLQSETINGDTKSQLWRAEDIVDFAWTAWPGYQVFTDKWEHVDITLLIPESRVDQVDRQMISIKNALEFFTENVGPYPWPHVTIVDPPSKGSFSTGMEYTTLFTSESSDGMPEFFLMPEMVTVHEFGHAYFMGILATNEFEEPWMDEGMNTFYENRIMDAYWGEKSSFINTPIFKMSDKSMGRISYVTSAARQYATNKETSWSYPNDTYSMMAYMKPSTWLYSLISVVGEETMNDIFREYYRQWAFKHPCSEDFVNVVNEVVAKNHGDKFGENMNWFFEQTLYGTQVCDYSVTNVRVKNIGDNQKYNEIFIGREGDMALPIKILMTFSDGKEIHEYWDGKERYKKFEYTDNVSIKSVQIDPDYMNRMDINMINNSFTVQSDNASVRRIVNKLMMMFQLLLLSF